MDLCSNFLESIELRRIRKPCYGRLKKFGYETEFKFIDRPIQLFCDKTCNPFLILDLVYVKIQYKQRLEALQTIWEHMKHNFEKKTIDSTAECLGISKDWTKVNPMVLERQALDLVKLIHQINSAILPAFIRGATNMNFSLFGVLSVKLSLKTWSEDTHALTFLRSSLEACQIMRR